MECEQSMLWNEDFGRWPGLCLQLSFWPGTAFALSGVGQAEISVGCIIFCSFSWAHTGSKPCWYKGLKANVPEAEVAGRELGLPSTALSLPQLGTCTPDTEFVALAQSQNQGCGGGEEDPTPYHTVGHQGELCSQEDPWHLAARRARMCPDRNPVLCSLQTGWSSLPKASGCLSNTLLCPVDCSISLLLLGWHAKVVEYLLPKLLPLWNLLYLHQSDLLCLQGFPRIIL